MNPLDIRDISIIDALPVYDCRKVILNVGCGEGRIDFHLAKMGYQVFATDIKEHETWMHVGNPSFSIANIFDLLSFPISSVPIIICSQVLEHLRDYKKALMNLLVLAETRLILTVPFKRSFHDPGHINFWDDSNIGEFINLCKPYSVSISKIITKPEDVKKGKRNYLIIIDKRQRTI